MVKKWLSLSTILVISILLVALLLVNLMGTNQVAAQTPASNVLRGTKPPAQQIQTDFQYPQLDNETSNTNDPPLTGVPCGGGEQMPPWIICLHGTVYEIVEEGKRVHLDGVAITVTLGERMVTGTSFVHPGQAEPSFGIDISSLEPSYMQPVTLTASLNGTSVTYKVPVFPDLRDRNQRFDVPLQQQQTVDNRGLAITDAITSPGRVWGYVLDFAAGGTITDAVVVAEYYYNYSYRIVEVRTIADEAYPWPYFALTEAHFSELGAESGDLITLKTYFNGDEQEKIVRIQDEPSQIDLITGWYCDGTSLLVKPGSDEGLPETTGADGLPETTGADGLPDVGCFWGYIEGTLEELTGVEVQLEVGGNRYFGQSQLMEGETRPRYGIPVRGVEEIDGQILTVTAAYAGATVSETATIDLGTGHSQQIDLVQDVIREEAQFVANETVNSLVEHEGIIWAGTDNGLVRVDLLTGDMTTIIDDEGPGNKLVSDVTIDGEENIWLISEGFVFRYHFATGTWRKFNPEQTGENVLAITIGEDDAIYFGNRSGEIRSYRQGHTIEWGPPLIDTGLNTSSYSYVDIEFDVDETGNIWAVGGEDSIHFFSSMNQQWNVYTNGNTINTIPSYSIINTIVIDNIGGIWAGTDNGRGVIHYDDHNGWQSFTETVNGLAISNTNVIVVDDGNTIWLGTDDGVIRRTSSGWEVLDPALHNTNVNAIDVDNTNGLIRLGTTDNIRIYDLFSMELLSTYSISRSPSNSVNTLAVAHDNSLWIGYNGDGLGHYFPISESVEIFTTAHGLVSNNINAIDVDSNDTIWIGTDKGLNHFAPNSLNPWQTFTATGILTESIISDFIHKIVVADDGSIWIGTDRGISHYMPETFPFWESFTEIQGLGGGPIRDIAIDNNGNIWAPTDNGISFLDVDEGNEWQTYTSVAGTPINRVFNIEVDKRNNIIWASEHNSISFFDAVDIQTWQTITNPQDIWFSSTNLAVDVNGDVWIGQDRDTKHIAHVYDTSRQEWRLIFSDNQAGLIDIVVGDNFAWITSLTTGIHNFNIPDDQSDLRLSLYNPESTYYRNNITYTLVLSNQGQQVAISPNLTLALPPETSFLDASLEPTALAPLTWDLNDLPISNSIELVVTATVQAVPGSELLASAEATTTAPETYTDNNFAIVRTTVLDNRPDTRVNIIGSTDLEAGQVTTYTIQVDNDGGSVATNTLVVFDPDPYLLIQEPLEWNIGDLYPGSIEELELPVLVSEAAPENTYLSLNATVSTQSEESDYNNNQAHASAQTALDDVQTLILVPHQRMVERFGAAPYLDSIYALAEHPSVKGIVVDIFNEPNFDMNAAYAKWESNGFTGNEAAEEIKLLIDNYREKYPGIKYLVIVGSDDVFPFYRVPDRSNTRWRESTYAKMAVPEGTVYKALENDLLLTDDFYSDMVTTTIQSQYWVSGEGLLLPELGTGRLVETPAEIKAVIDAFLANDGKVPLGPAIVGSTIANPDEAFLTGDLGAYQCQVLQEHGLISGNSCNDDYLSLRDNATDIEQMVASLWTSQHSNHFSLGLLRSTEINQYTPGYNQSILASIGCHAGLNVPQRGPGDRQVDFDIAQSFLGQGGTMIGSTSYGYGSKEKIGYSEALIKAFIDLLLEGQVNTIGEAMVSAKNRYYVESIGYGFSHLDEKVLNPFTLYGLPMLQISIPEVQGAIAPSIFADPGPHLYSESFDSINASTIVSPVVLNNLSFNENIEEDGTYYDHQGQFIEQSELPLQPAKRIQLPVNIENNTIRGVLLIGAEYEDIAPFNPYFGQPWALSQLPAKTADMSQAGPTGWDRALPYALGVSSDKVEASLNLVLGAFHGGKQFERLYEGLSLEVVYGDSSNGDLTPPTLQMTNSMRFEDQILLHVQAHDEGEISRAIGVCDNGNGSWQSVELSKSGNGWSGTCPYEAIRTFVQVMDDAGNVTISQWQVPQLFIPTNHTYLPTVMNNYINAPDLVVRDIIATSETVVVTIENIGTKAVTPEDRYFVDVYFDPIPPPVQVNQTWDDGRCQYGLVWGVNTTINSGESLTLTMNGSYYRSDLSRFPVSLPPGTSVYAQVDSADIKTDYGAVFEIHEIRGDSYNNIAGPVLSSAVASQSKSNIQDASINSSKSWPLRPK